MGDKVEKVTDKYDYMIKISFTLFGNLNGEKTPKELTLQRKLRNIAEDGDRFNVDEFEFKQTKLWVCEIDDGDD